MIFLISYFYWELCSRHHTKKTIKSDSVQTSTKAITKHFSTSDEKRGFIFISVPVRRRLPLQQMRAKLRQLHINTRRILEIQYPQDKVASFLIHFGYESEFRLQLQKFNISTLNSFDPLDPATVRHPDLDKFPTSDYKLNLAKTRIQQCICCNLQGFKTQLYNVVANFFVKLGLFDLTNLEIYNLPLPYEFTTGYIMDHA